MIALTIITALCLTWSLLIFRAALCGLSGLRVNPFALSPSSDPAAAPTTSQTSSPARPAIPLNPSKQNAEQNDRATGRAVPTGPARPAFSHIVRRQILAALERRVEIRSGDLRGMRRHLSHLSH
jgi:hypothetical protein